jgi:hypothetical protein
MFSAIDRVSLVLRSGAVARQPPVMLNVVTRQVFPVAL